MKGGDADPARNERELRRRLLPGARTEREAGHMREEHRLAFVVRHLYFRTSPLIPCTTDRAVVQGTKGGTEQ